MVGNCECAIIRAKMESLITEKGMRTEIIEDLAKFGCCNLCILRYLGNTEPYNYRKDEKLIEKLLFGELKKKNDNSCSKTGGRKMETDEGVEKENNLEDQDQPSRKVLKKSPCSVCLGLLDLKYGASDAVLDKIAAAVKEANIQAKSYTINLSLPIAVQFRAYFLWYHLVEKFSKIYNLYSMMKPESVCLKNAWKWICTHRLKDKVDPDSDWVTDGCLMVNISLKYEDDESECQTLGNQVRNSSDRRSKSNGLSRGGVELLFKDMTTFEFKRKFGDAPPIPSNFLVIDEICCTHIPVLVAGRYCKYSRNVSQTPWIVDGKRFHDASVEELIAHVVTPMMNADQVKFSASGREDVDVRMLGRGRPFVMEVISPKRTLFTTENMKELRNKINSSTKLISVRDIQIAERKAAAKLKDGEEFKTKTYCALCRVPEGIVVAEMLEKLNAMKLPIVLQQQTPIRVLHRRSLATRERSILSIKATPAKSPNLFKLRVQTQAGTYVKEFVHGDFGRTRPSVAEILECDADIVSLDVESVDFHWPPSIDD
ncbi:putative tRNA pseudouridine synthase Pus10 [Orchesella cincta]|uniref:tRNA pseudouridine(55) synthase n=1 Tax=Orchesella cincta TaxID=48709 RepID=A0A1D2MYV7_ORCCI|nr:putative tRNA pseudouridine synthase Pus10 [Orchesella cincta]